MAYFGFNQYLYLLKKMKILQLHNQYKFLGGEDVVLKIEKNLLINKGHSVDQIIRKNSYC